MLLIGKRDTILRTGAVLLCRRDILLVPISPKRTVALALSPCPLSRWRERVGVRVALDPCIRASARAAPHPSPLPIDGDDGERGKKRARFLVIAVF